MRASSIIPSVESVTKKWTKQRKAEERQTSALLNRRNAWKVSMRMTLVEAANEVLPDAYNKVSSGGKYPAQVRQLMYAARGRILELTGKENLNSSYFTQRLVPNYVAQHPEITASWDVVYDARGHFHEPHTGKSVAIGTLDVRAYLAGIERHVATTNHVKTFSFRNAEYPTVGPRDRFNAVMFIEKEGFDSLIAQVELAQRYDLAIMSTKGMPVVACRHLADRLCGPHDIPLLVLHDFDKSGLSILGTLQGLDRYDSNNNELAKRYDFEHDIRVIDLGVRLSDVQQYGLESEDVVYHSDPAENLRANGATDEEVKFLRGNGRSGRRVELNAFMSEQFIEWIESKLDANGIKKVVPGADVLEAAYRRAVEVEYVNHKLAQITDEAAEHATSVDIPKKLAATIKKKLKATPALPWDKVVASIAAEEEAES